MKKVSTAVAKQSRNISRQTLTIGLDLGDRNSWYCVLDEASSATISKLLRERGRIATCPAVPRGQFSERGLADCFVWNTDLCGGRSVMSVPTATVNFPIADHPSRTVNQHILIPPFRAQSRPIALVFVGGGTVDSWYGGFVQAKIYSKLSAMMCHVAKKRFV